MEMQHEKEETERVNRKLSLNRKDMVVRILALILTLVAVVVFGVDKQTTTVVVTLVPSLPPVNLSVTAKWIHLSAAIYFVVVNAIACTYSGMSLIIMLATRDAPKNVLLIITILDLMVVALLFSAIGATGSIGLIGYQGNSHLHWDKVCNVFDKFCQQLVVAVFLSFISSVAYLLLIVIAALNHHTKS